MAIYALHGFLGTPSDWEGMFPSSHQVQAPNLFKNEIVPFWEWSQIFNDGIKDSSNILVGYSMGGRLALHALIQNPAPWKAAIIISANPGIENPASRINRKKADAEWSEKFLHTPWKDLITEWNQQPVFGGNTQERHEEDFSRASLADAMLTWSLGNQEFLIPHIEKLEIPLLWIVGENDTKYLEIAKQIKLRHSQSKISVAPHAGHRVPWQQKIWFQKEVEKFL